MVVLVVMCGFFSSHEYSLQGLMMKLKLQYSCLENPMDRGAWQATVPGVSQSQTQLSELQQQEQFYRLIFLLPSVEVGGALRLLCLV